MLRFAADRRSLGLAACHFGLVAVAFVARPTGIAAVLLVLAIAFSAFMQLVSGHNAVHSPVFRRRGLNRAWQIVISLTFGYPVSAFVPVHNLSHHLNLQTPRDVLRTTEVRHRSNLANLLHHVVMATVHIHVLNFAYLREMRRRRPVWFAQVRLELYAVAAFIAVLVALDGGAFLAFVLLPYLVGQCMIIGFGYLQHDGCEADSEHDHSRNFLGPVFNWLIFDNGYHSIHHMRPGLHWSLCRAAHQREVVPHIHPGLNQRSVLGYMWRAYFAPGERLRYDGRPVELPAPRAARELWIPISALVSTGAVDE